MNEEELDIHINNLKVLMKHATNDGAYETLAYCLDVLTNMRGD